MHFVVGPISLALDDLELAVNRKRSLRCNVSATLISLSVNSILTLLSTEVHPFTLYSFLNPFGTPRNFVSFLREFR